MGESADGPDRLISILGDFDENIQSFNEALRLQAFFSGHANRPYVVARIWA